MGGHILAARRQPGNWFEHSWGIWILLLFNIALVGLLSSAVQARGPASQHIPTGPSSTPTPCQPGWAIVPSPDGSSGVGSLADISALSDNDIWAVGQTYSNPAIQTLVEHWDGTAWSVVPSPNVGSISTILNGVVALEPNNVWAVGSYSGPNDGVLIEHWDGSAWSIVPAPDLGMPDIVLYSIAAIAPNDIWAVGKYRFATMSRTLTMHWDGIEWTRVASPNPGPSSNYLQAVTAVAANDVWAVGYADSGTLTMHWDGSAWSVVPSPNPTPSTGQNELYAVAGVSSTDIWAVGYYHNGQYYQTLTMHWDGSAWSIIPSANVRLQDNYLRGITAVSSTDVWAVGQYSGSSPQTLIEHWDGNDWNIVPSPNADPQHYNSLVAVDALSANSVWAVGLYNNGNNNHTLVQKYTGQCSSPTGSPTSTATTTPVPICELAWRQVPIRDPNTLYSTLFDVEVISPTDIWVVGSADALPLIEHWNGTRWSVVPLPAGITGGRLNAVEAISATDIWAAGYWLDSTGSVLTLVLRWDGQSWRQVPSPNVTPADNQLQSLAIVSSDDIWAVGHSGTEVQSRETLILHWNGAQWAVIPSPGINSETNFLLSVAANSSTDVWAVGTVYYGNTWDRSETLIEHWDGNAWTIVPSPNPGSRYNRLNGITRAGPGDIWAVGDYSDTAESKSLIERWDGAQWTRVPGPSLPQVSTSLSAVSAISSNDIWAVGVTYAPPHNYQTISQHWDGTMWRIIDSPNPSPHNLLYGIEGVRADEVWAVGSDGDDNGTQPFVLRYGFQSPCVTPTATATATASPCLITFTDVLPSDYFYEPVRYLYCRGVISGYNDNTFRPYNSTTRGQLTKIVVLGFGLAIYIPTTPTFSDVAIDHPFYQYIETAAHNNLVSGYSDGTFRPFNNVTRGQLSKIVVEAAGWVIYAPPSPTFSDVPTDHPFYQYIETAYQHGIISGYSDGTFRPYNDATRGQISKIVYNALVQP